jgi:hypothetical protein
MAYRMALRAMNTKLSLLRSAGDQPKFDNAAKNAVLHLSYLKEEDHQYPGLWQ